MRRFVVAGSGMEGLQEKEIQDAVLGLSGKTTPRVLYIGTATYDLPSLKEKQTSGLAARGCEVTELRLLDSPVPSVGEMRRLVESVDVIVATGGNTLFAVDRWKRAGLDTILREAAARGTVLCGGSAGAICWFDGGRSRSADPAMTRPAMLKAGGLAPPVSEPWEYLRVDGLGLLPGLCCPHYDQVTNGKPNAAGFDEMMLRHPGERGICMDNFAALVVDGDDYHVVSCTTGKKGTARPEDGSFSPDVEGRPAAWVVQVRGDGKVTRTLVPPKGKFSDVFQKAEDITPDPGVPAARRRNPQPELSPGGVKSRDARGWRAKIGVLAPSTNTIVQPDFEDFRSALGPDSGVTNHFGRIHVENIDIGDDLGFAKLMSTVDFQLKAAADRCMTASCDHIAMGMSSPTFYWGYPQCVKNREDLADRTGVEISSGSFACEQALNKFGCKNIAVLSPYAPIGDVEVSRFFTDAGFKVCGFKGLRCRTPIAIAEVTEEEQAQHLRDLNTPEVEALVQVGTNLSFVKGAAKLEKELGKPVIAINTVTYWQALRSLGIETKLHGFGRLFEEF